MKTLICLLHIFVIPVVYGGDILIYSGTCAELEVSATKLPVMRKAFIVFDVPDITVMSAGEVGILVYGKYNGVKRFNSNVYPMRATLVQRPDLKYLGTFSMADIQTLQEPFFRHDVAFFRGLQAPLVVQISGNNKRLVNHPLSLKGSGFLNALGLLNTVFIQQSFILNYQEQRTIEANVANQSASAAMAGLEAYVKSLGYSL